MRDDRLAAVLRKIAVGAFVLAAWIASGTAKAGEAGRPSPFEGFNLPDAWEARFWAEPDVESLRSLEPKELAALVPVQAGLRFCRCPGCFASEHDDPLCWTLSQPDQLTCRRCGLKVPNDTIPAKVDKKVPEEVVEVLPGTRHRYPYHAVELERQAYPDERLYLAAKRDYEAREFLAKAALYAAVRWHEQPPARRDPALARLACVLLLRFAQVYPAYAVHYDQPGQPKFFQQANLMPPYRLGYGTAKWDWSGCLEVPLNLAIAYGFVRDDPALAEAGRALGDPHPARTIENDMFRAAAEFVLRQPDPFDENSLAAYRGVLAAGRLLDDSRLLHDARARLQRFTEEGFYFDGLWRQGDAVSHRRVLGLLDGWIDRLAASLPASQNMLPLARVAGAAVLTDPRSSEVRQAAWPAPVPRRVSRQPVLLGGAGLARLAVGQGADALDLELKGLGSLGAPHFDRLAIRLSVGGQPVLGDLDDLPPAANGWDRATASHNAVVIDGLNQRESPLKAYEPSPGSDILFFAADPDFQVVCFDDYAAYPQSANRYRHTLIAVAGARTRYALSVFEAYGGLQHDQLFHAAAGTEAHWRAAVPLTSGPDSLLPPTIPYVATARAEDGRWFVQAYGALNHLLHGRADRPTQTWLETPTGIKLRLHHLGDAPLELYAGQSPDPLAAAAAGDDGPGRAGLLLRRRSADGSTLKTTFVTVLEPVGKMASLKRAGRVASPAGTVLLYLETEEGGEHLFVNLRPGSVQTVSLADGQTLTTDALAVRVSARDLTVAGGSHASSGTREVRLSKSVGTIRNAVRQSSGESRGWFETEEPVAGPESLSGQTLIVRHGDGTMRAWMLAKAENTSLGRARLYVREEPGFRIDPHTQQAHYYQFPKISARPPHHFYVSKISRWQEVRPRP